MELKKDTHTGICFECNLKKGDSSQKTVYHCELCEKWFCEKHLTPKFPYFVDWDTFFDVQGNPEVKALFHTEFKREDGHPDFIYLRKTLEALELEEQTRKVLIKQAMDKMMDSERGEYIQRNSNIPPIYTVEELAKWNLEKSLNKPPKNTPSRKETEIKMEKKEFFEREMKTLGNKHGYGFWVPVEVYSDIEYQEKLDNATTMYEVGLIVDEYCKRHSIGENLEETKGSEQSKKKKHWWQ